MSASTVRASLATVLPGYMIPERFHFLERMPLTENGKVDRVRLRELATTAVPTSGRIPGADDIRVSRTCGSEEDIAAVWKDVLRLERIPPGEHFLDLGGNSALAAQIVNRLAEALQVELTVRDLFESPTLTELSAMLRERVATARGGGPDALPEEARC